MKGYLRLLTAVSLAATTLLTAAPANAQSGPTWFGHAADGQWYVGGKIGTFQNGVQAYSDAQGATIMLGYEFARALDNPRGTAAIELEVTGSFDDGESIDGVDQFVTNQDWDLSGIAAWMAWRTPGDIYFKGKIGLTDYKVRVRENGQHIDSQRETALGVGVGLGMRFKNNTNIELEVTGGGGDNITDVNSITLGGHISF